MSGWVNVYVHKQSPITRQHWNNIDSDTSTARRHKLKATSYKLQVTIRKNEWMNERVKKGTNEWASTESTESTDSTTKLSMSISNLHPTRYREWFIYTYVYINACMSTHPFISRFSFPYIYLFIYSFLFAEREKVESLDFSRQDDRQRIRKANSR